MKKSEFTDEQIEYALRQVEGGTPVADVCRQIGVSELRRMRQRKDESRRLKALVADLTIERHMLSEALRKEA